MVLLWPLPWLLLPRVSRRHMRLTSPVSRIWYAKAPAVAVCVVAACAALSWLIFGGGDANWFVQHALATKNYLQPVPVDASFASLFLIVTIPAMLFSPLGEEFLYRGFMLVTFELRWSHRIAMLIQASAFALVHLAHYGLDPFQPALIAVWLPSMFAVALVLGWVARESGSLWCAVIAHSVFNLGMNVIVFMQLPDLVGV